MQETILNSVRILFCSGLAGSTKYQFAEICWSHDKTREQTNLYNKRISNTVFKAVFSAKF